MMLAELKLASLCGTEHELALKITYTGEKKK